MKALDLPLWGTPHMLYHNHVHLFGDDRIHDALTPPLVRFRRLYEPNLALCDAFFDNVVVN